MYYSGANAIDKMAVVEKPTNPGEDASLCSKGCRGRWSSMRRDNPLLEIKTYVVDDVASSATARRGVDAKESKHYSVLQSRNGNLGFWNRKSESRRVLEY
jgi:hypothetical protein